MAEMPLCPDRMRQANHHDVFVGVLLGSQEGYEERAAIALTDLLYAHFLGPGFEAWYNEVFGNALEVPGGCSERVGLLLSLASYWIDLPSLPRKLAKKHFALSRFASLDIDRLFGPADS
eukprot:g20050.t1